MAEPQTDTEASTPATGHLVVVEDDALTREMLRTSLVEAGFSVTTAGGAAELEAALATGDADLVVLDLGLPDGEGLDILAATAPEARPPMVCVTSRTDEADRLRALENGADDYLQKPVNERELTARVRNILRRTGGRLQAPEATRFVFDGWHLDATTRTVTDGDGNLLKLTAGEFDLLLVLVRYPGRPLPREWLYQAVLKRGPRPNDRTIDVLVGRLRRKLGSQGSDSLIQPVRHVGYRFAGTVQ